jgi:DNA-binding CsgD family transcriptional regulator
MTDHASGGWPAGVGQLRDLQFRLLAATSVADLFARACGEARRVCGFERVVMAVVEDGCLVAPTTTAIEHAASDELRRRLLARPVRLTPGCAEQALLRGLAPVRVGGNHSVLERALGLDHPVIASVAPRRIAVALVVADGGEDRPGRQAELDVFGHIFGLTLEIVVGRARLVALREELHSMYASAQAVISDALLSPDVFAAGSVAALNSSYPLVGDALPGPSELERLLTKREQDIARLMVAGRSNREIAADLNIATDTVKGYVTRILRKLGAPNRVTAVRRYMELSERVAEVVDTGEPDPPATLHRR